MNINSHAAQIAQAMQQQKQPPSQIARQRIAASPELADSPFGRLVASIARGESAPTDTSSGGSSANDGSSVSDASSVLA